VKLSNIRRLQKESPGFEAFIPDDIFSLLTELQEENGWTETKKYNTWFYKHRSRIPKSSVKRWTRAFLSGNGHSNTPAHHVRYREDASIIPDKFSDLRNGRIEEERKKWVHDGYIRYVNFSDFHYPSQDGALLSLVMQIIEQFQPNVMPYMSDWQDMDRFNPHPTKSGTMRLREVSPIPQKRRNKYNEFETATQELIDAVDSVVPADCSRINVWGNHEQWILRHLIASSQKTTDTDMMEWYIDRYFTLLQDNDVLWVEADRNDYFPLTEHFWITHGFKARKAPGATARAYMGDMWGQISIAAGHTHRQETLWAKSPVSEHFYAIAGTLGTLRPGYAKRNFLGHNWGGQLITHPVEGWKGADVEDIRIHYRDGFYVTTWRGKEYSERATIDYDDRFGLLATS
jgi:hypothetical protein